MYCIMIPKVFKDIGIHENDPRFVNYSDNKEYTNSFINKYNRGQLEINNWKEITNLITEIYNEIKSNNNLGNVADYIPQLAKVDEELFGIVFMSIDGQVFEIGDTNSKFCIQSCSKPITYGIILEEYDEETVHNYVGKEPSGRNFNELCLNEDNLPHNPLINSGAIMSISLIKPNLSQADRFQFIYDFWQKILITNISFNNSIYLSEKDTADRNYCLGYMMQEKMAFQNGKNKNISEKINRNWGIDDLKKNT